MHYFLTVAPLSYCTSLQHMKIFYLIFAEHLIGLHSAKNTCLSAGHSSFKRLYSSPRCIFQNAVSALCQSVVSSLLFFQQQELICAEEYRSREQQTNRLFVVVLRLPSWTLMLILTQQICKHKKHFYSAPYQQNLCQQNKFCWCCFNFQTHSGKDK